MEVVLAQQSKATLPWPPQPILKPDSNFSFKLSPKAWVSEAFRAQAISVSR